MSKRAYFGTDGIRGLTNISPMTAEMAMKVGMAAGRHFLRGDHRHRVAKRQFDHLNIFIFNAAAGRAPGRRGCGPDGP